MPTDLSGLFKAFLRLGAVLVVLNEIRGIVLAAPVFYGLYQAGGTLAAIWLAICALGGIALSVAVPAYALRRLSRAQAQASPA